MPNHWESSARPLFVKTVFVDGNRHAILSQEDPLLHSSLKKHSRPNSSLSIASVMSLSNSESEDCDSVVRIRAKAERFRGLNGKDISSQLQDCLIKLRVASGTMKNKSKCKSDMIIYNGQNEENWTDSSTKENYKEKRNKINRVKSGRKNSVHFDNNFPEKNKLTDTHNSDDHCCYVYNYENNKGKKNYCYVKIMSKPSQILLNCSCEKNWEKDHICCDSSEKNNLLISATFQNFIMTTLGNENSTDFSHSVTNSDSQDFYWNNYLTKSFNNSLSERVIQWLDLASKRKKGEQPINATEISSKNTERLFAGKTFLDENKPNYCKKLTNKTENKEVSKKEKAKIETSEKDIEAEVKGEGNVETVFSIEGIKSDRRQSFEDINGYSSENSGLELESKTEIHHQQRPMISIPAKIDPNFLLSAHLNKSISDHLNATSLNSSNLGVSVQELILNDDVSESSGNIFGVHYKRKIFREKRGCSSRQPKHQGGGEEKNENDEFKITAIKYWERQINQRNKTNFDDFDDFESRSEGNMKKEKNKNLALDLEKFKKSIDIPNITQSRPATNQKLLSPQQPDKISWARDAKASWASSKNLGRPQLHIFIPSLPLKDSSEECFSECENFMNDFC